MNVNDEYQLYCNSPTDENLARLYDAAREYALSIAGKVLPDLRQGYYYHACENAAGNVVLDFNQKFDPQRGSFSTWAYQSIRGDLIDWRRKKQQQHADSLDAPDFDQTQLKLPAEAAHVDEKLSLERIISTLSEDEQTLYNLKARMAS